MRMYKNSLFNLLIKEYEDKKIVFNTYSNALVELDNQYYDYISSLKSFDLLSLDSSLMEELIKQGIIVPFSLYEFNKAYNAEKSVIFSKQESFELLVTSTLLCNMHCKYCFENSLVDKTQMPLDIAKQIIEYLKINLFTRDKLKRIHITWFGGEPLLCQNIIFFICKELVLLCEQRNVVFTNSLITNGLLLTSDLAIKLKEEYNFKDVQITLDGTEKEYCRLKGVSPVNYQKVISNISECCDDLLIAIRVNITQNNLNSIKELIAFLQEDLNLKNKINIYLSEIHDYDDCCVDEIKKELFDTHKIEDEIKLNKFYDEIRNVYHVGRNNVFIRRNKIASCWYTTQNGLCIGPKGEFYTCEHHIGNKKYIIGNVKEGLFYNQTMELFYNNRYYEECKTCALYPKCLGGCIKDRIHGINKNYLCNAIKHEFQERITMNFNL